RRSRSRRRHHVLEARRHDESDCESGEYNDGELLGLPAQRLLREDVAPPKGGAFFLASMDGRRAENAGAFFARYGWRACSKYRSNLLHGSLSMVTAPNHSIMRAF